MNARAFFAEGLGTALLVATIVGSGIMAERLAAGNVAIALLGNTVAIGAVLFVLITLLGPISGARFNPVVSLMLAPRAEWLADITAQISGGVIAVIAVHAMFDLPLITLGTKTRTGAGQWLGEFIATFGLLLTIVVGGRVRPGAVPTLVTLWIVGGIWFTASTCFANPAVTFARTLTDSFTSIRPADALPFIAAQLAGAAAGTALGKWLIGKTPASG